MRPAAWLLAALLAAGLPGVVALGAGHAAAPDVPPEPTREQARLDGFAGPASLALDRHGNLYVAEKEAGALQRVTPGGERLVLARELDRPRALAVERDGAVLVATRRALWRVRPDGLRERLAVDLPEPTSLVLDRDGGVWVSCGGDGSVRRLIPTPDAP